MSLVLVARQRRRLLMHLEKHKRSASSATKHSPSVSFSKPFSLDHPTPPAFNMPSSSRNFRAPPPRARPGRAKGPKHPLTSSPHTASPSTPLLGKHLDSPKSSVNNFAAHVLGAVPKYVSVQGLVDGHLVWRTTVNVEVTPVVTGVGDDPEKAKSVSLAALSAAFQLNAMRILDTPPKPKAAVGSSTTVVLSNSTTATYEQARSFMDYYCMRFGFGKPDIQFIESRSGWEALMDVGGRRIGIGKGTNKKNAQIKCYLDVTAYLESCDPDLWKTYLQASITGSALGMAPKIFFEMSDQLDDEIRDLCVDVKNSQLYRKRPAVAGDVPATLDAPADATPAVPTGPRSNRPNPTLLAEKSARLSEQRQAYLANPQLEKMRATRAALPVYTRAEDVLSQINENDVTICMAATGSGKTTQIPQLILDSFIERGQGANCNVVCTQPRRLAAVSVADRVSKERGETLGKSVGYQVRFEAKMPEEHGNITFCTTGVFLKRLQSALSGEKRFDGRSLDDVTHVVVDEVHERDVDTDLLLVVLKQLMEDRKRRNIPLKIILMSATIDPTLFQHYFPDDNGRPAKVIEIPGRSFPVTKHFMDDFLPALLKGPASWVMREQAVARYVERETSPVFSNQEEDLELPTELVAATIAHVLQLTDSGHVLVFLPGWDDIVSVQKMLLGPKGPLGINFNDPNQYSIHLLHSTIPLAEQQVIFEPPKEGIRRIILSTNIAETSVTIPDVVYVVDTAKIKEQRYDPQRHMSSLVSAWVGSSNLNQRAGRAGRHRSGEYYGLPVEMKRVDLSNVVMHVKALNFPGLSVEDVLAACIEPPLPERVDAAMKDLQMVGALDVKNNLSSLGRVLLQIPVEVQLGRLVLYGCFFRCLDQALTLAAILSNRDAFMSPMHLKLEASRAKLSWTNQNFRSDALAQLSAFNAWWNLQSRGEYITANRFCSENFLSKPTFLTVQKTKVHLLQSLFRAGVIDSLNFPPTGPGQGRNMQVPPALNVNGDSQPLLAALIAIASQPKFAIRTGERSFRTSQDKLTFIHPSSVNNRKHTMTEHQDEKQLYAFMEKRQNTTVSSTPQTTLVTTTRLDPLTYMLFGAYKLQVTERGLDCDGWLPIVGNLDALDDIQRLKTLMESSMLRVFEGITMNKRQARATLPVLPREEEAESEADDEEIKDLSLSRDEVKELDFLTRDIVRILNRYSDERARSQSRHSSRPATPYGRSGFSTPSRPGTPSRGLGSSRLPF
ncbi:P-loop containing nucleoside triphosphate hydrolase protein [Mycena metata]|uniref:P-loop containing nucleoside triphosphate hydrolase protein n=1 Tax=Mycena metata TaxID=1033252 RepID=A0AAD7P2V9_9AGAR|nr:P-loop containing nucleoside triphosphate hydrolase protein [Mycena metata]